MSLERGRYYAILGALITRERKRRKWTQTALAKRVDVSQPFLSRIELGKLSVDTYLMGQIADKLFGVTHGALEDRIHRIAGRYQAADKAVSPTRIASRDAERSLIDYIVETSA